MIDAGVWKEKIRAIWAKGKTGKEKGVILLLFGLLLLVVSMPSAKEEKQNAQTVRETGAETGTDREDRYVEDLERRLETILSEMEGAGEVSVMVTLQSSAEKVIEKDTESEQEDVTEEDSQGGSRTTKTKNRREETVYGGEEEKYPYISKEISPQVEGVVVIAEGGDHAVVVQNITESVQALFGIDTHKIRIVKGRRKAD